MKREPLKFIKLKREYILSEEQFKLLEEKLEAIKNNDKKRELELRRLIPMHPLSAVLAKRALGAQGVIDGGFNLEWANEEFGDDWLTR